MINLQGLFERSCRYVTGDHCNNFKFIEGKTFLSTKKEVFGTCILYLVVIFTTQHLMTYKRKPFNSSIFQGLFRLHNLFLSVLSLVLLILISQNVMPLISSLGCFGSICSTEAWTTKLELLYYVNYLTKYYELLDTVFMCLKKKKLEFLHVYHHSLTVILCYVQLQGKPSVAWVPITLNLAVHVVMYYYYYLSTFKKKIWWKKYITIMQITQFVIDLVIFYFCMYAAYSYRYFPALPQVGGDCAGTASAAHFGCFLLSSYLLLFVDFFVRSYRNKGNVADKDSSKKLKEM